MSTLITELLWNALFSLSFGTKVHLVIKNWNQTQPDSCRQNNSQSRCHTVHRDLLGNDVCNLYPAQKGTGRVSEPVLWSKWATNIQQSSTDLAFQRLREQGNMSDCSNEGDWGSSGSHFFLIGLPWHHDCVAGGIGSQSSLEWMTSLFQIICRLIKTILHLKLFHTRANKTEYSTLRATYVPRHRLQIRLKTSLLNKRSSCRQARSDQTVPAEPERWPHILGLCNGRRWTGRARAKEQEAREQQ